MDWLGYLILLTIIVRYERKFKYLNQCIDTLTQQLPDQPATETPTANVTPHAYGQGLSDTASAPPPDTLTAKAPTKTTRTNDFLTNVCAHITQHYLYWIGGLTLSLGGIFFVSYAIEQGVLPPGLRILLGGLFGVGLLWAAQHLHNHPRRFNIHSPHVVAAIGSAGLVTLQSMVYVSAVVYPYIPIPVGALFLLGLSLFGLYRARDWGSTMTLISMATAYLAPFAFTTPDPDRLGLALYVVITAIATAYTTKRNKQPALSLLNQVLFMGWATLLLGVLGHLHLATWLCVTVGATAITCLPALCDEPITALTRRVTRSQLAILHFGALVGTGIILSLPMLAFHMSVHTGAGISSLLLLATIMLHRTTGQWRGSWVMGVIVALPTILAASPRGLHEYAHAMDTISTSHIVPFLLFINWSLLALYRLKSDTSLMARYQPAVTITTLFVALSITGRIATMKGLFVVELCLSLCLIAVVSLAMRYTNRHIPEAAKSLMTTAHLCALLMLFAIFVGGSPTLFGLSLIAYVSGILYLEREHGHATSTRLSKVVLTGISGWLTLITIAVPAEVGSAFAWVPSLLLPGSIAILGMTYVHMSRTHPLTMWIKGACLHLCVIWLTLEASLLKDLLAQTVYVGESLAIPNAAIFSLTWLVMGLLYVYRGQLSQASSTVTPMLYRIYGYGLLVLGAGMQLGVLFGTNPYFFPETTGTHPLFNWLILLWGFPALAIGLAAKHMPSWDDKIRTTAAVVASGLATLYINSVIRLSFGDTLDLFEGIKAAELYTYTAVWMLIALGITLRGHHQQHLRTQQAGLMLLGAVVAKAFLWDMAALDGLYRALSFMGMGGSLVGLGWWFQRLSISPNSKSGHLTHPQ